MAHSCEAMIEVKPGFVFMSTFETSGDTFYGFGQTEQEAEKAIFDKWQKHSLDYGVIDPQYGKTEMNQGAGDWVTLDNWYGVTTAKVLLGKGYTHGHLGE